MNEEERVKTLISGLQKTFLYEATVRWFPAHLPNALFLPPAFTSTRGSLFLLTHTHFLPLTYLLDTGLQMGIPHALLLLPLCARGRDHTSALHIAYGSKEPT